MVVKVQRTEPTTAVCVVRIERQPTRPLITIRINYDITRVSTDAVRVMADAEAALEAVRDFLEHASGERVAPS